MVDCEVLEKEKIHPNCWIICKDHGILSILIQFFFMNIFAKYQYSSGTFYIHLILVFNLLLPLFSQILNIVFSINFFK